MYHSSDFSSFYFYGLPEINRMQTGGAVPVGQVSVKQETASTNGSSISGLSDSPAVTNQGPLTTSAEVAPTPRPLPQHQFRRPADVFDSKLYKPTKLTEKVFIPVKEYPKVGD